MKLIYHENQDSKSLDKSPFYKAIEDIVKNANNNIIKIVSPYLDIDIINNNIIKNSTNWQLITDIKALILSYKKKNLNNLKDFLENNKKNIYHCKNIHAKVLIFDNKALLGSANFTTMGLEKRDEMSILIEEKEEQEQVKKLNKWFDSLVIKDSINLDFGNISEKLNTCFDSIIKDSINLDFENLLDEFIKQTEEEIDKGITFKNDFFEISKKFKEKLINKNKFNKTLKSLKLDKSLSIENINNLDNIKKIKNINDLDNILKINYERTLKEYKENDNKTMTYFDKTYLKHGFKGQYKELGNMLLESGVAIELLIQKNNNLITIHKQKKELTLSDGIKRMYQVVYITTLARRLALPEEFITQKIEDVFGSLSTLDFINRLYDGI